MLLTRSFGLLIAGFVFLSASNGIALNSIYLTPPTQTVVLGDTFNVELMMDFDDVTVGGGVEIAFDSLVLFQSFVFDPGFSANFGLSSPAPGETVQPLEIGFGFFFGIAPFGETGLHHVGTLTFFAAGFGSTQMITTGSSASSPGPFFSPTDSLNPLVVDFGGATVDIVPIPEPSTALLFGLGLVTLGARRRS